MAKLIMGKYAISKLSIILYHKEADLSIGIAKNFKNFKKLLAFAKYLRGIAKNAMPQSKSILY